MIPTTSLHELIPVLQVAIGPVILISGIGLLLLSLTNRFGRAVDRSRQLAREMRDGTETDRQRLTGQVDILFRRAKLIRFSITAAVVSILLVAVLIITLFISAWMNVEAATLIGVCFIGCLTSLVVSLGAFLREIHLSLTALKLELGA